VQWTTKHADGVIDALGSRIRDVSGAQCRPHFQAWRLGNDLEIAQDVYHRAVMAKTTVIFTFSKSGPLDNQ
jgi:hypothetical protein